jgi:hypothetical protein
VEYLENLLMSIVKIDLAQHKCDHRTLCSMLRGHTQFMVVIYIRIDTVDISRKVEHLKSQSMSTILQLLEMESVKYNFNMTRVRGNRQLL